MGAYETLLNPPTWKGSEQYNDFESFKMPVLRKNKLFTQIKA